VVRARLWAPFTLKDFSGCGGIGRHARFRFWWREPWGFKSLHPHQFSLMKGNSVSAMANYKETQSTGLKKTFKIVISASDIEKEVKEKLLDVGNNVKIPGFRPGKIPFSILEKRYKNSVMGEVIEESVKKSFQNVIDTEKLNLASYPDIAIDKDWKGEGDLPYEMNIELLPDMPDVSLDGFKLNRYVLDPQESDLKELKNDFMKNMKDYQAIESDRPAKDGDRVILDYKGFLGEDAFEGGEDTDAAVTIGAKQFIPGFEEALIGVSVGQEHSFDVTFPKEYGSEDLAGKQATFKITLKKIEEQTSVKDENQLKEKFGFETDEDFDKFLQGHMTKESSDFLQKYVSRQVLDHLDASYDFPLPEVLLEQERKWIEEQEKKSNEEDKSEDKKLSDEEQAKLKDEIETLACRRVKLGLLITDIAKKKDLSVSSSDLQKAVLDKCDEHPQLANQIIEYYGKDKQAMESLKGPILESKVIQLLGELANEEKTKISFSEFKKLDHMTLLGIENDDDTSDTKADA
jgi:trigger factor